MDWKKITLLVLTLLMSFKLSAQFDVQFDQKIVASDRKAEANFSTAIDREGSVMIVGAFGESYDENQLNFVSNSGAAYIFTKNAEGDWEEYQKLVAIDRDVSDRFGYAVTISGDYAAVVARFEDEDENGLNTLANAGSVYVFKKNSSGTWVHHQKLVAPVRSADDYFGSDLDMHNGVLVVGANNEDEDSDEANFLVSSGSAYIFELNNSTGNWEFTQKITQSLRTNSVFFGGACSVYGNWIAVSATSEARDENELNPVAHAGAVYFFEKNTSSGVWEFKQKVVENFRGGTSYFGSHIQLDKNQCIIGARSNQYDENEANALSSGGAVYIFNYTNGSWSQTQKLVAPDRRSGDGLSVCSISGDYAVAGAAGNDYDENDLNFATVSGALYVFRKNSAGTWEFVEKVVERDRATDNRFGSSVHIEGRELMGCATWQSTNEENANFLIRAGGIHAYEIFHQPFILSQDITLYSDNSVSLDVKIADGGKDTETRVSLGNETGIYIDIQDFELLVGNGDTTTISLSVKDLESCNKYYAKIDAENSIGTDQSDEFSFFSNEDREDFDCDGISNRIERRSPFDGDANGDGILDFEQRNVSSLLVDEHYVTLELTNEECNELYEVGEVDTDVQKLFSFPYGAVEFKVNCSFAVVKLYFHGIDDLSGFEYGKLSARNSWFEFEKAIIGTEELNGSTVATVTLTLTDGGPEDYDGQLNGSIHDPGGPAILNVDANIPIWDWWWVLLLIGGGWYAWRKIA